MPDYQQPNPFSFESFIIGIQRHFVVLLLAGISFGIGVWVGSVVTENKTLRSGFGAGSGSDYDSIAQPSQPSEPVVNLEATPEITKEDHIRGNRKAQVTLIEYSDFECPFCQTFHPTLQQAVEDYDGQVAWVYRHFPLAGHSGAQPKAEASECVAKLEGEEAFWQYNDLLFVDQSLSVDGLADLATQVGVNSVDLQNCLDSGEMKDKVQEQFATASAIGISGTPSTVLVTSDGQYEMISGALPLPQVKATIEKYLN